MKPVGRFSEIDSRDMKRSLRPFGNLDLHIIQGEMLMKNTTYKLQIQPFIFVVMILGLIFVLSYSAEGVRTIAESSTFSIDTVTPANEGPGIASVTEDTNGLTKTVDDVITVTVTQADDGTTAVEGKFSIGDAIVDKQLTETSARIWTGTYTVLENDMVVAQPVIATLKSDAEVWTAPPVASETKITIDTIAEINEVAVSPTAPVGIGGVITVTAVGEANAQVTFSIGEVPSATDVPMTESPPGNYTGNYAVQENDCALNAALTVSMKDAVGNIDTKQPAAKSTLDGVLPTVENPNATPKGIIPDGMDISLLTVDVADTCGGINNVIINLSYIGGDSEKPMYDDGTNGDVVSGDGVYSCTTTVAATASERRYEFPVTLTDVAGNVKSDVFIQLYVDNTPPDVSNPSANPSTVPCDGNYTSLLTVKVIDEPFGAEYMGSVTIDLTELDGSEIQPMYDDGANGDEQSGDGVYSCILTIACSGVENGTYQLSVTATDIAGNLANGTVELIVNCSQIIAEIAYPEDGDCLRGLVCITGTAQGGSNGLKAWVLEKAYEDGMFIPIKIEKSEEVSNGELARWDTTKELDGDGNYTLKLTVTDKPQNQNVSRINVMVDNTPPFKEGGTGQYIRLTSLGAEGDYTKSKTSITASGKTEGHTAVISAHLLRCDTLGLIEDVTGDISIDAMGNIEGVFTVGDLSGIEHAKLRLCVRDCAGNEGSGESNHLTVDDGVPYVEIITPANCAYFCTVPINIAGNAKDDISGVAKVEVNTEEGWALANGTTSWNYKFYPPTPNLPYTISARVTDRAGNQWVSPNTIMVNYFTGLPTANIRTPTDGSEVSCAVRITGSVEDYDLNYNDFEWRISFVPGIKAPCSEEPCGSANIIETGYEPVHEDLLVIWDTSELALGDYTLCLTVSNSRSAVHVRRNITVQSCTILYGDVSGDGLVTAYDASLIMRAVVGLSPLDARQHEAAEVSGDGKITAYDAALILRYVVGLIDSLPTGATFQRTEIARHQK